jgi:hypothetical protein
MREAILESWKTTQDKLRWDGKFSGIQWEIYIPKWRVPKPWPGLIRVKIGLPDEFGLLPTFEPSAEFSDSDSVTVICRRNWDFHSPNDAQFEPLGNDEQSWQIGTSYIPFDLLPDPLCERVVVQVSWDRSRRFVPRVAS